MSSSAHDITLTEHNYTAGDTTSAVPQSRARRYDQDADPLYDPAAVPLYDPAADPLYDPAADPLYDPAADPLRRLVLSDQRGRVAGALPVVRL